MLFLYRDTPRAQTWGVLGLALLAGAFRFAFFQPSFDDTHVAFYNDGPEPCTLTGVVADEPDVRDTYQNLRLRAENLSLDGVGVGLAPTPGAGTRPAPTNETRPVQGLVLVRAPRYPERFYGDRLQVTGRLETPPILEGFSYKDYLARFGIHSLVRRPSIELIESGQGSPVWTALYALKARTQGVLARTLPEPYAALLAGILLGVEAGIPKELYEQFNATGTSHIIVISGFNIAIVAGLLMRAGTRAVGKRRAAWMALAGIAVYTLLVGGDAAVVRAAIMGGLYVLASYLGRPSEVRTSLVFSALAMTAANPLTLWDVGFQLSFAATAGLIWLVPPLERAAGRWLALLLGPGAGRAAMGLLSEALLVTLAAQIATGPLIVYHFGRFSLVSLLTNLLILPVQPTVMLAGGLAAMAGLVWLPAGQLLAWLAWLPLAWTVGIVEATARLPFASLELGRFSPWLLAALYAALAGLVWRLDRQPPADEERPASPAPAGLRRSTRLMFAGGASIALLVWLAVLSLPDGRLHVAFLDVGQGDAVLITTPRGRQILVDGGPSPGAVLWRMGRHMPFWDRSLDLVVNTHPDADHLAGLPEVLARYRVSRVLVSDVESESALYAAWEAALAGEGAEVLPARAGDRLALDEGVWLDVLHPGRVSAGDKFNDHSVVARLAFGRVSFLLPGDVEAGVEQKLAAAPASLAATVLKAPHHGGDTSSTGPFLAAVDPQVAVISVGADNRFGHPSPEVLVRYAELGIPVLRTDERGTIELSTDGDRLWVETTH
jgi:competence protein ComEC